MWAKCHERGNISATAEHSALANAAKSFCECGAPGQIIKLPSWKTLKAKIQLLTQTLKTQSKASETLATVGLAQTRHYGRDGTDGIHIQCSKLKVLTKVNPIKNSQLKRGQITKSTRDRFGDYINHFGNTN
ncbi:hypothetical protein H5410_062663 [Solanum commersonii]|uniref:Uncharacterized protein n=1 Tax=Solanum commersonii TaxID=4109 RepID=A0A9J5WBA1_SOLCO|nr:hypothetical protein H5410_062663 [Solanum commersonii]